MEPSACEKDQASTENTDAANVPTVELNLGNAEESLDLNREAILSEEFVQLARKTTSIRTRELAPLFPIPAQGPYDPNSPSFNAREWAKAFYTARKQLTGRTPRTASVAFKDLNVFGYGTSTDFQKNVANVALKVSTTLRNMLQKPQQHVDILHDLEGVLYSGEILAVLGPPGSGCSTFLKTLAGDTHGFHVSRDATLNYGGIRPQQMQSAFKGEAIYTAEDDHHFAHLTVGDTLYLAARARCPRIIPDEVSRREYAEHLRDVTMAMFGISHTRNTRVGDDFIRGVSGGERKRVTIAEAALSYAPLQCWDNSTRGLDSANALEFIRTLRTQADTMGCTSAVAIYQASQDAFELFDKVLVLYEGRQIYFGRASEARPYFESLGFICPGQQTSADFCTSMTSAQERIVRPGWENRAPRSPDDFARAWKESYCRTQLVAEIDSFLEQHPFDSTHLDNFLASRREDQSKRQRAKSPYTLSYIEQIKLTLWRGWVMLKDDPSITLVMLVTNIFEALIVGSIVYGLPADTAYLTKRSILLFFMVIMAAFGSILEIITLYAKRKIVEKHARYALYHPSAEALSAMLIDLPYKILNTIFMNLVLYFMGNLRRETGPFLFFLLIAFTMTLTLSMMFRFIGSITKSIEQALAPASMLLLAITLYTGFAIPPQYMQSWASWIRWLNPIYYGFESVMLNEFVGRRFPCQTFVPEGPGYQDVADLQRVCSAPGSVPGQDYVVGEAYLSVSFGYDNTHRWRNWGVMIAYMVLFMILHLVTSEYIASERSKGEVLVYARSAIKKWRQRGGADEETTNTNNYRPNPDTDSDGTVAGISKQSSVFHWRDVCYEVKIKGQPRRILDHVDGWVKPGTLTALMGASGAGKTTLLDALASRITMGVITGDMLVDGKPRDSSFQRKTGYVQQQDLHLHSSTVREALNFSALLRQPAKYSREERLAYVDTVIGLLSMEEYADAVVGIPGEGLNVELAAPPELLLFLDEPTSGLDSQTSWSICNLMEKLTRNGQAILCTIHQPSAILFQRFDRLLLLAKGGRTVYFGDIGAGSQTLLDYFVRNGAAPCPPGANPAEYMLHVIGAAPGAHTDIDWPAVWKQSPEYTRVQEELGMLSAAETEVRANTDRQDSGTYSEFAAPYPMQFYEVTKRAFQEYWRNPSYIYSKAVLSVGAALFIGLSFINADNTQRGLQNQMFGAFLFLTIFGQVAEQIMPVFVSQRTLYESRERPSKTYSWVTFLMANILVEIAWNSVMSIVSFILWYFPIGFYRNGYPTNAVHERGITVCLYVWAFFVFTSTFAHMMVVGVANANIGAALNNLFNIMMFAFSGILAVPGGFPGFWIFMYRVNPFKYVIEGLMGTALSNTNVTCASNEYLAFRAPSDGSCSSYLSAYIDSAGGYLLNPDAGSGTDCEYCSLSTTNAFLEGIDVYYENRWRNFGFMWVFIVVNIVGTFAVYWLVRVPKKDVGK
ncbi:hypothetical protein DL770_002046 [Monosporascus sp. CRB-9-2]|nr:hypothetical protein DL770_002046 [Monosporascus sp. CRB-9-2]